MTDALIFSSPAPGFLRLDLARPDRGNALEEDIVEPLISALGNAAQDSTLHTVVFAGEGRHFCTGFDLSDLASQSDGDLLRRFVRIETLLSLIWTAPFRTIACAKGRTWGAGADLFTACDIRLALQGTCFRFPGAAFGLVLGTRRLAQRIGADAARATVLTGGELTLAKAEAADCPPPAIDAGVHAAIHAATRDSSCDRDLADLVRSASPTGLRDRIQTYAEGRSRAL